MARRDPRIDAYIAKSADFAKPILRHLRAVVHRACPEVVEELKWSSPHFNYLGMFCGMAAFKAHCVFGFWKGSLISGDAGGDAMDRLGRITSLEDLPGDAVLTKYLKQAMKLNETGVRARPTAARKPKPPVWVPADLKAALARQPAARATFEGFPPSKRRDYVEWITEAKTEATRARRLATSVEWLAEGKSRHWKYEKC